MWLLIEVKDQHDIGKNEITRVLVRGAPEVLDSKFELFNFTLMGVKVHPATKEENDTTNQYIS